ncbi:MAG: sulfatase-like hydrolase/transferase [Caldilineaceae bacterium SB0662_bin_9]|uniref:Sulfatase-like hydrolase/transferase n=1 Tax=Caldilineaceae bacterium SB0662_bin_9 TaxID=2605258 RepID=A0A6B1DY66_9CHLR|nr:sulfatase-like hydrolase/transferase [Caldilineaceae bacterium]MYD92016.1 sulfatase-like hydrolase/transferase [Caldilineaceae bacterium SB0662_bin_9]
MPASPNILFVMDDQHRHDFLGLDTPTVSTPHIDRLARQGTRFTHCCVNAPVCAPSRISLASGLHPWRMGAVDNSSYLPLRIPTYYQRLRDHGYKVASAGKLDLAKPAGYNGRHGTRACNYQWGFTDPCEIEGKMHAGRSDTPQGPYGFMLREKGQFDAFVNDYQSRHDRGWIKDASHDSVLTEELHSDTYVGERANRWLQDAPQDAPWHMFVSFVGPHDPFDPPTSWAERYRTADMPEPITSDAVDKPAWVQHRRLDMSPEEILQTRRQYAANISLIDHWVGKMLNTLAQRGMLDNTIVIFASDHGEMLGDHGLYTKSVAYEASLRVPLILSGPGIPAGETRDTLAELSDINPTICELAGVPYLGSEANSLDAKSLMPTVRDSGTPHRDNAMAQLRGFASLRTDTHKLILNWNSQTELYDLVEDPGECHNIADQEPNLVNHLRGQLQSRSLEGGWHR